MLLGDPSQNPFSTVSVKVGPISKASESLNRGHQARPYYRRLADDPDAAAATLKPATLDPSTETVKADVYICPLRPQSDRQPSKRDPSLSRADIGPLVQVENVELTRCLDSRLVTIVVRVARNRIPSQLSFLWMLAD